MFRAVRVGCIAFSLLFLAVTLTPVVKWLTLATEQDWNRGNAQVMVVLAGSMLVPGTGADATLGADTYLRCVYAAWEFQRAPFRQVVVTGDSGAGEAMARYLELGGVPASAILIENRAANTYQNAMYVKHLLLQRDGSSLPPVLVLTSDYHCWRARRVFLHQGFQVNTIPVPDVLKRCGAYSARWPAFLLILDEFSKDAAYRAWGRI